MSLKLVWSSEEKAPVEQADQDGAVRALANSYVDACRRGDVLALRALFHPDAAMSGFLGDSAITGGPEPFFEAVAHNPSPVRAGLAYDAEITAVCVHGRTATVVLYEWGYLGMDFINNFQLIFTEGQWYITAKLFDSRQGQGT
ncbi:MAG: nuclear transport factor 2 family protein [Parahaliea sp.]